MREVFITARKVKSVEVMMGKGWFTKTVVNSDQVFQALIGMGERLDPGHCFNVLLWFGAIQVNGEVPGDPSNRRPFARLLELNTVEERRVNTTFTLGLHSGDESISALQSYLRGFHLSWVLDVPLTVSA